MEKPGTPQDICVMMEPAGTWDMFALSNARMGKLSLFTISVINNLQSDILQQLSGMENEIAFLLVRCFATTTFVFITMNDTK